MASTPRLPLEGVRIIAVEQYGALPFGTMHLADLGAEVIKPSCGAPVSPTPLASTTSGIPALRCWSAGASTGNSFRSS